MLNLQKRIENFSLIWKTISEVFYAKSKLKYDLDEVYSRYLKKIINVKTDKDYYLLLAEFVTLLNDGHTDFNFPKNLMDKIGYLPFTLVNIGGVYYINDTIDDLKIFKFKEIIQLNNIPFRNILRTCFRHIHNVNGFAYTGRIEKILPFYLKKKNNKIFFDDGTICKFNLLNEKKNFNNNIILKSSKNYEKVETKLNHILKFENDILYIYLDTFNNISKIDECVEILKKQKNLKAVIIDVRNNEGGMSINSAKIASLFINGKFSALNKKTRYNSAIKLASSSQYKLSKERTEEYIKNGITTREKVQDCLNILNGASFESYNDEYALNDRKILNCKCYILTSKYTISAAEDFVAMFKSNNIGVIVGDNTYGSTGTPYVLKLSDGSSARICTVKCSLLNGTEFINKGIEPDIYHTNSIKNYRLNNDKTLDFVIDLINKN